MIDAEIQESINIIKENIDIINNLMAEMHSKGVEIRIAYKDSSNGSSTGLPRLDLWRATEHVDYLKE
jgi:hypothetical protein